MTAGLPAPPVVPTQQLLPLLAITPEQFQSFCRDLVKAIPGIVECRQHGVQGDRQGGIDLVARTVEGETVAYQCRRVRNFAPGDLQKIAEDTTFEADRYYALIGCRATAGVREEEKKHARWRVWEVDDISAEVRALPPETARRIVRTNFGGRWCWEFLGLQPFTAFLSPDDFFQPLIDPLRIFNHSYALAGRTSELAMLDEFLSAQTKLVFVLSGRGGIGKTKVLQTFAERARTSHDVYFVQTDVAITPDSLNELPLSNTVLVIDDAHRRDDLGMLLTYATHTRTKLVLATRPQLRETIPSLAANHSIDVSEIVSPASMKPLGLVEMEAIAREVLGRDLSHLGHGLAVATKDCPLITVVGGRLLRDQRVPPALLANDETFREAALAKFFDEIVEHAAPGSDESNVRRLLEVVAALAPVHPSSQRFISAVTAVSSLEPDAAIGLCSQLEHRGVLDRRDDGLRIMPDLLSDYVLGVACERAVSGKTFVQKVVGTMHDVDRSLLRNLAALDWRVGMKTGRELSVLGEVWDSVVSTFKAASHSDRRQMLRNLKEVGYFLPKQMLALAKLALEFPSSADEMPSPFGLRTHASHEDVIAELPDVVRHTAFSPATFDAACDFLWQLANDESIRAPRPALGEKSASSILQGAMGYGLNKQSWVHEKLFCRLQVWLKVAQSDAEWIGILSIAKVLFNKTMGNISDDDGAVRIAYFPINPQFVRVQREAALAIAASALEYPSRAVVGAGVKALVEAIKPPPSLGGLLITDEQIASWRGERLTAFGHIEALAKRNTDPVIGVLIRGSIEWYAEDDVGGIEIDVRNAAKHVVAALREELPDRVARAVCYPWGSLHRLHDDAGTEQARMRMNETARDVVVAFKPPEVVYLLNDCVEGMNLLDLHPSPSQLVSALAHVETGYTTEMCRELLAAGEIPLAAFANCSFWPLRSADPKIFHELIRDVIARDNLTAAKSLVATYGWWVGDDPFTAEDLDSIRRLHEMHVDVAVAGLSALPKLAKQHPSLAAELVLAVDLAGNQQRAVAMATVFFGSEQRLLDTLTDEELERCVRKLALIPQLEDWHLTEMLKVTLTRVPLAVLEMFADRIELEERGGDFHYTAIPMHVPDLALPEDVASSERYRTLLRRIDHDYQSGMSYDAQRLFTLVAGNMNGAAIAFLRECSARRTDSALTFVASCLRGTGCRTLILSDTSFTRQILDDAATVGQEVFEVVEHALSWCAVPRTTTDQLRAEILQRAEAARDRLAIGEKARDFYQKVATEIQRVDLATHPEQHGDDDEEP